ncbi:hypothetical protein Tsubulata_009151 [Turnera subulata]|uniref:Uncharacterized protein n=1 Tax=Turnera subulata TaxID=218843 RepID=A0A9Q0GBJ3_9ROSI|nr:hypothetical protein Tsubulata_009151 [Turnera subulata]
MSSSAERSLGWEDVQRQGLDLADRLTQGFTGLIQSHIPLPLPLPQGKLFDLEAFSKVDLGLLAPIHHHHHHHRPHSPPGGVSALFDIGNRIGQAGLDLGAGLNALLQQFFRGFPLPFKQDDCLPAPTPTHNPNPFVDQHLGLVTHSLRHFGLVENHIHTNTISTSNYNNNHDNSINSDDAPASSPPPTPPAATGPNAAPTTGLDAYFGGFDLKSVPQLAKPQGTINITSTYDSLTRNIESSLIARGDLWRVEASHGSSTSASDNSSLFLLQLGPVLFVRDTTLLLPVHLSKQHLLWYGFDRKPQPFCKIFPLYIASAVLLVVQSFIDIMASLS